MNIYNKIDALLNKRNEFKFGGGTQRINQQHEKGKQTARERIDYLLDEGSFVELNPFMEPRNSISGTGHGEGVVTGYGKINGRPIYLFAHDFTVLGGALGEMHALKICNAMDLAAKSSLPFIGLNDSGGARIQEGVASLDGYGKIFYRNSIYSGVIPQISVIMGSCAGGAVYSPAMTDVIIMVDKTSHMFITGPTVIKTVTGAGISSEDLGGAHVHNTKSGNAHVIAKSEAEALEMVKDILTYFPNNNAKKTPKIPYKNTESHLRSKLATIVPMDSTRPYDIKNIIHELVDEGTFFEIHKNFARNIVVGFARLQGESIGLVTNQPRYIAGGIDINSSDKAARFIRLCDAFNIPLITLEDVTGFLPGIQQEHNGIIRHGAKILFAYSEATVPKITVIIRKAFGGAYVALNSKSLGADIVYAWPNSEVAVMGAESAVNIINAKEIAESDYPEQVRQEKINIYKEKHANPYVAAGLGMVDDVIDPRETRIKLIQALEMLYTKQEDRPKRKHGNIPL